LLVTFRGSKAAADDPLTLFVDLNVRVDFAAGAFKSEPEALNSREERDCT
jgi:hypothetical protein